MALRELFHTFAITSEFLRAYMGGAGTLENRTSDGKLLNKSRPSYGDLFQQQEQQADTEWECSAPIGTESISTTKCIVTYDDNGNPVMQLSVEINDSRPGPYKLFSPIKGTMREENGVNVGIALVHFQPSIGHINGDLSCAQEGNWSGNALRSSGSFQDANAITDDLQVSNTCFANYEQDKKILIADSDGVVHEVTLKPIDGGNTGLFQYITDTSGNHLLYLGTDIDNAPFYIKVEDFFAASEINNINAGETDRVTVDLEKLSYPDISIPDGAIRLFPQLQTTVEPPANTLVPEAPPNVDLESLPSTPSPAPDTEQNYTLAPIPEIIRATPRVDGVHETMYEFVCPAGEDIDITTLNPANHDAIAMYEIIKQAGWHPNEINEHIQSIKSHQGMWGKFKDSFPDWLKKIFKITDYPFTAITESCETGEIRTSLLPLMETVDEDHIRIIGMNTDQNMVIVTLTGAQAQNYLTPRVTASLLAADGVTRISMTDPAFEAEVKNRIKLIGEDKTPTYQTPKIAPVLSTIEGMSDLVPGYDTGDLLFAARDPSRPVSEGYIIDANGYFVRFNPSIPSGFPMRFHGTMRSSDGQRLVILAFNPLDLPYDTDPAFRAQMDSAYIDQKSSLIQIAVPDRLVWSPYTKDQDANPQTAPTPQSYAPAKPTYKYETGRLALSKFTSPNTRKNRTDIKKSRANAVATVIRNNNF